LSQLAGEIAANGLPIYLIDDGSGAECKAVLAHLSQSEDVNLLTLPVNRGKGAAVCMGLRQAWADGFSHAIQIDADGQYSPAYLNRFVAVSDSNPGAVVSGRRSHVQMSTQRARGRRLTDFWVCINTLSRCLQDSMCGYRLYPLEPTIEVINRISVGKRMDFDTDLLVRLYWAGFDVVHVDIDVVYADDIPSHFNLIGDNVRISWMHIRHFFGMLPRFPRLVSRHFA